MIKLVLYLTLTATWILGLIYSYVPVLVYYSLTILQPQLIWFWACRGVRVSFITALAAIVAFILQFLNQPDLRVWKSKQAICLLGLWIWMFLSVYFGAFPTRSFGPCYANANWIISTASKMFLMSFITMYLIQSHKELRYLCWAIILPMAYLIYWGNMQYITGAMYQYNPLGRLWGPYDPVTGGGTYTEENTFAMLFVTTLPFFYYFFQYERNKLVKLFLLLLIPLGWHCVFLTGSRGGLLGLGITILYTAFRSQSKSIGWGIFIALIIVFIWQGGSLMKQRAKSIEEYQQDRSAESRITSWKLGLRMMEDYPIFGVGLGNFVFSRHIYGDDEKLIAMSTPIEFGANSGIPALLFFLGSIFFSFLDLKRIHKLLNSQNRSSYERDILLTITNAVECALLGFFVCGLFLSMQVFEPFYLLIAMVVILKRLARSQKYAQY